VGKPGHAGGKPDFVRGEHSFGVGKIIDACDKNHENPRGLLRSGTNPFGIGTNPCRVVSNHFVVVMNWCAVDMRLRRIEPKKRKSLNTFRK